jgi:hypothetical protein
MCVGYNEEWFVLRKCTFPRHVIPLLYRPTCNTVSLTLKCFMSSESTGLAQILRSTHEISHVFRPLFLPKRARIVCFTTQVSEPLILLSLSWLSLISFLVFDYRFVRFSIFAIDCNRKQNLHECGPSNIRNYWGVGLSPSSDILDNREHDVSETGSVFILRWGGKTRTQLGSLERTNHHRQNNSKSTYRPSKFLAPSVCVIKYFLKYCSRESHRPCQDQWPQN